MCLLQFLLVVTMSQTSLVFSDMDGFEEYGLRSFFCSVSYSLDLSDVWPPFFSWLDLGLRFGGRTPEGMPFSSRHITSRAHRQHGLQHCP